MSNYQVTWTKDQRAFWQSLKDHKEKSLFAFGLDCNEGRYDQTGIMGKENAVNLFLFVRRIYDGKTPAEAFKETYEAKPATKTAKKKRAKLTKQDAPATRSSRRRSSMTLDG